MTFEPWFFTDISILLLIESRACWSLLAERTLFGPASVIRSTNCAVYSFFIHAMTGSWTLPSIQLIAVTNLPVCISHHSCPAQALTYSLAGFLAGCVSPLNSLLFRMRFLTQSDNLA